jgi:hypothetical protein
LFKKLFGSKPKRVLVDENSAGARRKAGRPTRTEAAERRRQRTADQKAELDLEIARAKSARELKKLQSDDQAELNISDLARLAQQLERVGLTITPKRSGNRLAKEDGLPGFFKGFFDEDGGRSLAKIAGMYFGNGSGSALGAHALPAGHTAPAAQPPSTPHRQAAPPAAAAATAAEEEPAAADPRIQGVIEGLSDAEPDEAAKQILRFGPFFGLGWLIDALINTPDGQRGALFATLGEQQPQGRPLLDWLASRPDWTQETINAMRQRRGVEVPSVAPASVDDAGNPGW